MYYVMRCWGWLPCRRQKWITSWICWHWRGVGSRQNPGSAMSIANTERQPLLEWFASETGMLNVGSNLPVQATAIFQKMKHNRKYLSTFGADDVLPVPSACYSCLVAQSCPTLRPNPMHCSTPGFPVLHHLLLTIQETWVRFLGREDPPEEGNGNPLQCSCLGNPMDRGAWRATVHGVTKSLTRLSDWQFHFHFSHFSALIRYKVW